jgi:hypothetical protein
MKERAGAWAAGALAEHTGEASMSFFDRLFGRRSEPEPLPPPAPRRPRGNSASLSDEQALARYRYMMRTAPPETIEQAHAEAFAKLTPEQRAQVLRELGEAVPERERAAVAGAQYEPRAMARAATRAEMRQPGITERAVGGMGGGMGMGGMLAGSIFGSLVAGFVGSMAANMLFDAMTPDQIMMVDQGADPATDADMLGADSAGEADYAADSYDATADDQAADFDTGDDFGGDDFGGRLLS